MKKSLYLFFLLLTTSQFNAQKHEFGVFAGGSNAIGDIGNEQYIAPNKLAFGLLYRWNQSSRHAWRFSVTNSKIYNNDIHSKNKARRDRYYFYKNQVTSFSAGIEFNFFEFDLQKSGTAFTPYIHTGISSFKYDNLFYTTNKAHFKNSSWAFAIPMTIGAKVKLNNQMVIGAESTLHYTFVDDLDGSKPKEEALKHLTVGNTNSTDWYVFTGLTLTYTFGETPCYCKK